MSETNNNLDMSKLTNLADAKVLYDDLRGRVERKADKVANATNGNFAGLDASGNLVDSGKKPSDFLTEHQDISGKVDKETGKGLSTNDYTDEEKLKNAKNASDISELNQAFGKHYSANLMGMEKNVYYPVRFSNGDGFTIFTSDNSIFDAASETHIQLFDKNKTFLTAIRLNSGYFYRTGTLTLSDDAYFAKWYKLSDSASPMMVMYGANMQNKAAYVPYFVDDEFRLLTLEEQKLFPSTFKGLTVINSGDDLNSSAYLSPGNFVITSAAVAEHVSHMPVISAGRLYVYQSIGEGAVIQEYITSLGAKYYRRGNVQQQTFEQWRKLVNDKELAEYGMSFENSDYASLFSRNLIGMETDVYYPVEIANGEHVTFSTSDGSLFDSNDNLIRFYDIDKNNLGYLYLNNNLNYRTHLNNYGTDIRYIRWISQKNGLANVMVVKGNAKQEYYSYYAELKSRFIPIEKRILALSTISSDPIVLTENIDPDWIYSVRMGISHGRGLSVEAKIGNSWKPVKLVNINTGKESYKEYQHGEYLLIGTTGATQIKCTVAKAATTFAELWLIKYGTVPYVHEETKATAYLPEYSDFTTTNLFRCFGLHDGYAYGIDDNKITRCNLTTSEVETFYTASYNVASAMIMDNGNIMYVTSADTENKMYLLKNGVSTVKHDFYDSTNSMRLTPNRLFSLHQYKSKAIVCEYNGAKTPISGYKAYMSDDYGENWSTLFDLTELVSDPATNNAHLHSCVYDPYGNMYWACSGDTVTVDGIWYSVDKTNWYKIQTPRISMKPTEIIPMRDCVLFVSDSGTVNVYKWQRCIFTPGDTLWLDTITMFVETWGGACPIGAIGYHDPKMNIAFFGYDTDAAINAGYDGDLIKHSDVFVTDGYRTQRIYRDTNEVGCIGVYGNDDYIAIAQRANTIIIHR